MQPSKLTLSYIVKKLELLHFLIFFILVNPWTGSKFIREIAKCGISPVFRKLATVKLYTSPQKGKGNVVSEMTQFWKFETNFKTTQDSLQC